LTVKIIKLQTLRIIVDSFYAIINDIHSTENVISNCYEGLCVLFSIIGGTVDPDYSKHDQKSNLEEFNKTFKMMIEDFENLHK